LSETPAGQPLLAIDGGIARVTLRRPEHRNRLHNEDLQTLSELLARINADASVRVTVLRAEVLPVRPVFCAGYNIGNFDVGPPAVTLEDVMLALEALRPVTICELNGSVYGGAADFALVCDLALGAEGIEMRIPAAVLGLHYHPGGLERLVSRLGAGAARQALLTAEPLDAQTLLRVGYIQELWPAADLAKRVDALAAQVASLAPLALEALKQSLNELARGNVDRELMRERARRLRESEDFVEGRRAFAERRPPVWKGR
jgi:enoyl-CoA hydratase/carnithine racemase